MFPNLPYVIVVFLPIVVNADYKCLCSYKVELPVNSKADRDSTRLGLLYEFDCKPTVEVAGLSNNWQSIAYEQQLGYVFLDSQVQTQVCPGKPSVLDLLTTHSYVSTTSTSPRKSTRPSTKSTIPTFTTTPQTSPTSSSTATTSSISTTSSTSTAATTTTASTAKRSTTTTKTTTTTPKPTTTTRRITSTTTKPTTTSAPVSLGDVRLCPHTLHQYTIEDKGALGQFGNSCYEIVPIRTTWLKAEKDCVAKGGHLFHISNQREQDFVLLLINSNQFAHACWMGLHDLIVEEMFEWTSGDNVTYTNWWHDRKGNFFSHHTEDCVLFVPFSPYFGKWDDAPCGSTNVLGVEQGQRNPFICQFNIHDHFTYVPLANSFGRR